METVTTVSRTIRLNRKRVVHPAPLDLSGCERNPEKYLNNLRHVATWLIPASVAVQRSHDVNFDRPRLTHHWLADQLGCTKNAAWGCLLTLAAMHWFCRQLPDGRVVWLDEAKKLLAA